MRACLSYFIINAWDKIGTINFADMEGWNVAEIEGWKVADTIFSGVGNWPTFFFQGYR